MTPALALAGATLLILVCLLLCVSEASELVVLFKGAAVARRYRSAGPSAGDALLKSPLVPGVAVIVVPADASAASRSQVRSLLKLRSGDAEVMVVLDGPSESDRTVWIEDFRLEPSARGAAAYRSRDPISLLVIERERGGLAACLNTAVSLVQAPLIAVVDEGADVSEEALLVTLERFISGAERTVAVCAVGPAPAAPGLPARLYRLEFLRTWLGRCALVNWNSALPAPGSFTLFDRDAVLRLGGFRGGALEMVMRLHQMVRAAGSSEQIGFLPLAVARPRAPRSWKEYRAACARIRSEERRAVVVSGFIQHCYVRPVGTSALVVLAAAGFWLGWMDPHLLAILVAATVALRILTSMTAALLGEFAAPAEAGPADLLLLVLAAVCFWKN